MEQILALLGQVCKRNALLLIETFTALLRARLAIAQKSGQGKRKREAGPKKRVYFFIHFSLMYDFLYKLFDKFC